MSKFIEMPGVRLKIREDGEFLCATIWIDNKPIREVLRSPLDLLAPGGSDAHHAFADAAGKIMRQNIEKVTGLVAEMKRRKPDYKGEAKS